MGSLLYGDVFVMSAEDVSSCENLQKKSVSVKICRRRKFL